MVSLASAVIAVRWDVSLAALVAGGDCVELIHVHGGTVPLAIEFIALRASWFFAPVNGAISCSAETRCIGDAGVSLYARVT
eukprot:755130-Hanusia_phi.AAC.2